MMIPLGLIAFVINFLNKKEKEASMPKKPRKSKRS